MYFNCQTWFGKGTVRLSVHYTTAEIVYSLFLYLLILLK